MAKLLNNLVFLTLIGFIVGQELPKVVQPQNIKIYIKDETQLVDPNQIKNLDDIQIAKPIADIPKTDFDPKSQQQDSSVQQQQPEPAADVDKKPNLFDEKFPSFFPQIPLFFNPFDQSGQPPQLPSSNDDQNSEPKNNNNRPMKGIISVLLMKSFKKPEDSNQDPSAVNNNQEGSGFKSSLVILKYLPKKLENLFGDKSDPDNQGKHLLGGDTDVDHKRVHLLGGGGENDPDIIRFKLDNQNLVMTGQDDLIINHHKSSMHSMMDRIKHFLHLSNNNDDDNDDESSQSSSEQSNEQLPPFIIRTDDGSQAIIPNDSDEKRTKSLNNCMMLNFMRLKASIYYRTILHMLFFTGILLFILSMVMITFRTFRKRRYTTLRYSPHNMSVSSIDGDLTKDKAAKYTNSIKGWYGSDRSSLIRGPDGKHVLVQAPPAYDQVIIDEKKPTNNNTYKYVSLVDDDKADTKSIPPEYEHLSSEEKKSEN